MKCEKCQDRGFTEKNHGLIMIFCDCDKAMEVAEKNGIPRRYMPRGVEIVSVGGGIPEGMEIPEGVTTATPDVGYSIEEIDDSSNGTEPDIVVDEILEESSDTLTFQPRYNNPLDEVKSDSSNGTQPDNQPIGSTDTSKPKQPQKPKAKKRAGKRTS